MASSLELNKLLAGVLTAGVIAVGAGVIASILYRPQPLEEHAFSVIVPEDESTTADAGDAADAPAEPELATLLASADPAAGETITRQCAACHVFNEGGENRVGPALWGVVGRDIASASGFGYSNALTALDGEWTFESLNGFLTAPRDWAPGTSMSYAGLRDAGDRANLIAYLQTLSNDPVPLPAADTGEAAPAEEEVAAAPAEEAATEAEVAAVEEPAAEPEPVEAPVEEAPVEAMPAAEAEAVTEEPVTEPEVAEAEAEVTEEAVAATEEVVEETAEVAPEAETEVAEATVEAPAAEEAVAEAVEAAPAEAPAGEMSPMVAMVAAADPAAGEAKFRQCAACHSADQGGQNRVGPNLWGVFGADVGHHEGFNYSDALLGIEGIWTVDKLNAYLENPRAYAAGNRMAFAGLRSEADRAAVIAYLHSLSDDPKPLDIE